MLDTLRNIHHMLTHTRTRNTHAHIRTHTHACARALMIIRFTTLTFIPASSAAE